jgi:hypothetical protein
MPVNAIIIRALQQFYLYYGDNFRIECPTGSGKLMNLFEVSKEIADRLTRIFTRDPSTSSGLAGRSTSSGLAGRSTSSEPAGRSTSSGLAGRRPVFGGIEKFQADPHWRDYILFYEYFHGDNGAGLGASHQTGWTGVVAKLIQLYGLLDPKLALEIGTKAAFIEDPGKAGKKKK